LARNIDSTGTRQADRRLGGGANQSGSRAYNERLVLSLIRRLGPISKAELARTTGLSPQTVTLIVNRFDADGTVLRKTPLRGRVGQPSVPYSLNPAAAFSFGLKIGRRSVELVLGDFLGGSRRRARQTYTYPTPDEVLAFARAETRRMRRSLSAGARARLVGIGVSMPFQIWNWSEEMGVPAGALDAWRDLDVAAAVEGVVGLPAHVSNDATAACGAELSLADDGQDLDYAYLFVGWFIGGGLVLDGSLFTGRTANAGALGSMPVWSAGGPIQLLRRASLYGLAQRVVANGADPSAIWDPDGAWSDLGGALDDWIAEAAISVAQAIAGVLAVLDLPSVVIDGAMPEPVRDRLVAEVCYAFAQVDRRGLSAVEIRPGRVGPDARLLGASMLPILANFTRDSEVLFKVV
jgi:predicted NBD/HSP70 family sugar kinase